MTRRRAGHSRAFWTVLGLFVGAVAVLRPWTVRPITEATETFDPRSLVGSSWDARVLPAADAAIDLLAFLSAPQTVAPAESGAARAIFVRGKAVVSDVDRRSRVGLARLKVPSARPVALQIGPVLRGTALRDALPFIRFTDFANQLEFAEVSSALNDAVTTRVLAGVNLEALKGQTVTFVGAVAAANQSGLPVEIVPVRLRVSGGEP